MELKKEENTLKEQFKSFQFFLDNLYIKDLNSIIIGDNRDYNKMIKSWINPFKKIKAQLLFRLSRDGEGKSKFHELCDNISPTLIIYNIESGNKIGIYTPLSWDKESEFKDDMDTFMFNLKRIKKHKKICRPSSIYCRNDHGSYTKNFSCDSSCRSLREIWVKNGIDSYFESGMDILPGVYSSWQKMRVNELEVFKIIILD